MSSGGLKFAIVKLDNKSLQLEKVSWVCPAWEVDQGTWTANYPGSAHYMVSGGNHGYGAFTTDTCTNTFDTGNYLTASTNSVQSGCPGGVLGPLISSFDEDWGSGACVPNLSYMEGFNSTPCTPQGGWLTMNDCAKGQTYTNQPPKSSAVNDLGTTVDSIHWNYCSPNNQGCGCNAGELGLYIYADDRYANPSDGTSAGGAWHYPQANGTRISNQGKGPYNETMNQLGSSLVTAWPTTAGAYNNPNNTANNRSFYAVGRAMSDMLDYENFSGSYNTAGAFMGYNESTTFLFTGSGNDDLNNYGVNQPVDEFNDGISNKDMGGALSVFKSNLIMENPYQWEYNSPGISYDAAFKYGGGSFPDWYPTGGTDCMSYYAIILFPTTALQASNANNEYNGMEFKLHLDIMSAAWQKSTSSTYYQFDTTGGPLGNGTNYSGDTGMVWTLGDSSLSSLTAEIGSAGHPLAQSNTGMQHHTSLAYATHLGISTQICEDIEAQAYGGILDGGFERLDSPWWEGTKTTSSPHANPWGKEILNPLQKHILKSVAYKGYPASLTPSYADMDATILVVKTPAMAPHWRQIAEGAPEKTAGAACIDPAKDNLYFNLHVTQSGTTVMYRDVVTGFQDDASEVRDIFDWAAYINNSNPGPYFVGYDYNSAYSFKWQQNLQGVHGHGIGLNADIHGTTTIAGEPINMPKGSSTWTWDWVGAWEAHKVAGTDPLDIKIYPLQYTGFDFYLSDSLHFQVGTGQPQMGQYSPGNSVQHSFNNNVGNNQGTWYEYDGRINFNTLQTNTNTYDTEPDLHHKYASIMFGGANGDGTARAYSPQYLNSAGHANYTSNSQRHLWKKLDDVTNVWSYSTVRSAVTFLGPNDYTYNQLYGMRDDSAHIRFLGVTKVYSYGNTYGSSSTTGWDTADRFKEVLWLVRNVNHSTGDTMWANGGVSMLLGESYMWGQQTSPSDTMGFDSLQVTANGSASIRNYNNWTIQTGNGMIYNGDYQPNCTEDMTVTHTDEVCSGGGGTITITMTGQSSFETFTVIESSTGNPINILNTGPPPYIYAPSAASNTNTFDIPNGAYPTSPGFNNNSYTIEELPVGIYTVTGTTPFSMGGCSWSYIVQIFSVADLIYDVVTGVQSYSYSANATPCPVSTCACLACCSRTFHFSAENIGANDSDSHGLCWTSYLKDSAGVYRVDSFGTPWYGVNNGLPNAGTNPTGMDPTAWSGPGAGAVTGVVNSGDVVDNLFYVNMVNTPSPGNDYRVYFHLDDTVNVVGNSTVPSLICDQYAYRNKTCDAYTCSLEDTPPTCGLNDSEYGITNQFSASANSTGVVPSGYFPTQVGSLIATENGVTGSETYVWTDNSGAVIAGQTTSDLIGFPPGSYTLTVTDTILGVVVATVTGTIPSIADAIVVTSPTTTAATCGNADGTITGADVEFDTCTAGTTVYALTDNPTPFEWDDVSDEFVAKDANGTLITTWTASSTFVGLAPGIYYLIAVGPVCGCAYVLPVITITSGVNFVTSIGVAQSPCNGGTSTITATVVSGTANYTYTWTSTDAGFVPPAVTSTASATSAITATGAFTYTCVITETGGCPAQTETATTTNAVPMLINGIASNIGCGASSTSGSITTAPSNGTPTYTYQWSNGSTATSQNLSGITVGTYTVVVTDANSCTATETFVITSAGAAETFVDLNQYEYNKIFDDTTTNTTNNNLLYGMYGGPTCPGDNDGTIRIMLDSSTPTGTFPYDIWIKPGGSGVYQQVTNNAGSNVSMTSVQAYDTSTGNIVSTGVPYDTSNVVALTYFQITGNSDKAGGVVLPFTDNSTWDLKFIENGGSGTCIAYETFTILPSDYQNVVATTTHVDPSCCACSSYGASGINTCDGSIDLTPTLGTYENQILTVVYTYLWEYATLPSTCSVPGHNNTNTQWSNVTTQDLPSGEWPGIYTCTVTDTCSGTSIPVTTLDDPIVYIDDITWTHPQCSGCCDGTLTLTAHGGNSALEISFDNGSTFKPFSTGTTTFYGKDHASSNFPTYNFDGCGGIFSIWVKDGSGCAVEYFADPDDSVILGSYTDNCFAEFEPCLITTSGTWTPSSNSDIIPSSTGTAFTDSACTKIHLIALSNLTNASACVTSHNQFPGDTAGAIYLQITGGVAPYTISVVPTSGPIYDPNTGLLPCSGIGPLTPEPGACTLTNTAMPNIGLGGGNVWTVSDSGITHLDFDAATTFTTSVTYLEFENVSVSLDLGSSFLGAQYRFYVQDSIGCVQLSTVGVDNGLFGLVSIYGAVNCDCICPIGFTLDLVPGSATNGECISTQIAPIVANSTTPEYWTTLPALYNGGAVPVNFGSDGAILYGNYDGVVVNYGLPTSVNILTLPFYRDLATAGSNLLVMNDLTGPVIAADIAQYNPTFGAFETRLKEIAIWRNSGTVGVFPVTPQNEWIGMITETNFPAVTEAIVAISGSEEVRMYVDGVEYIHLDATSGNAVTVSDNTDYTNLFAIILPAGLHAISFQAMNTTSPDSFLAFEVYPNTLGFGAFNGWYFIAASQDASFTAADLAANVLPDANGNPLNSLQYDGEEIQIGTDLIGGAGTMGYSCPTAGTTVQISGGTIFCQSDVTAPCEVPLDCGNCYDVNGDPAPDWTKKGPCETATGNTGLLLLNEWISDASALADLVECPGTLANEALAKIKGALASNVLDIRQVWLTIMIKHMLQNLNLCFTLSDIQESFTGYLDDVCPTCNVGDQLTPAQMEEVATYIFNTNNSNFDF